MENNHIMLKQKPDQKKMLKQELGVFDILKEAIRLIYKNPSFIVLAFLTSLPLFIFSIYYELHLQRTLLQISEFLKQNPGFFNYNWQTQLHTTTRMTQMFSNSLIQLGLLYLIPLHLLEICTAFVIVDLASKLQGKNTFREVFGGACLTKAARFRGTLVTSIWVLFLSTCTVVGSTWLVSVYYVILRNFGYYNIYCRVLYKAACMALLANYLEWGAIWSMSIVISILENTHGANALMLSANLSRGRERQGLVLTLIFGVWGLGLRLACLFFKCYQGRGGIVAQIGFLCTGNVVKWVAYMIYSYKCKKLISEKKVDVEIGKVVEITEPYNSS